MIIFQKCVQVKENKNKNKQVIEENSNYHANYNCSIPASLDLNSFIYNKDTLFIEFNNSHLPKKYVDFLVKLRNLLLLIIYYINISTKSKNKTNQK